MSFTGASFVVAEDERTPGGTDSCPWTPKNIMQVGTEGEIFSLLVIMRDIRISI